MLLAAGAGAPAQAQILSAPIATKPATPDLIERAEDRNAIDLERASLYRVYALSGDSRLPAAYRSTRPWRGTLVDLRLRRDLPRLDPGRERQAVAETLRAPPNPNPTTCSTSAAPLTQSLETPHFYIQFEGIGGGLSAQAYAESLEEAYTVQVAGFRWAGPPQSPAGQAAIPGKYHVRIEPLARGLYGFVSSGGSYAGPPANGDNPNTPWPEGDAEASCMVLNSDFETGFPGTAQQALDATTAHEYNHSIQYGYGALDGNFPDDNFIEGAATWMEDEAQDGANDNYNYLYPAFTQSMGQHPSDGVAEYSYWLTFRGITERFGANVPGGAEQVMQEFWERVSRNDAVMLDAFNGALVNVKGRTLAETFHDYAIGAKLMRPCGGGYFLPYCFQEAAGYSTGRGVPPSQSTLSAVPQSYGGSVQDDYAINWVTLQAAGPYNLTLSNTSEGASAGGRLRATVACDTGFAVAIAPFPATVTAGQATTLTSFTPSGCVSAPVAVITNEAQTAPNPSSSAPRSYTLASGAPSGTATSPAVPARPVERAPDNGLNPSTGGGAPTGGGSVDPGPRPVADNLPPLLSGLGLSSRRFRAARAGSAIAAAPVGTRLRYRLSEAATLTVRYERRTIGRRVDGRCRAVTRRNRGRARCSRWVLVRGSARRSGKAGANSLRLSGRIAGRALKPGVYRLRLFARDGAGNTGAIRRSAAMRIVRR